MKYFMMFIFITLWLIQAPEFVFAQNDDVTHSMETTEPHSYEGLNASFKLSAHMEVKHDGFGGYLYSYRDGLGNKYITNNIDHVPQNLKRADSTEYDLFAKGPDQGATDKKQSGISNSGEAEELSEEFMNEDKPAEIISDPLEPINRAFFHFNDKLYFWFLKPVASGYKVVVPQPVRVGVRNFFSNVSFPVRFVNCIFQGKIENAGVEWNRFFVNTFLGLGGFVDVAAERLSLKRQEEDLGQTLGSYGMGPGFYINWPILGPSSLRDTVGSVGDGFLEPLNYLIPRTKYNMSVKTYNGINETSLTLGDYEDLKRAALDPYIATRDAYFQYRRSKIKE